MTTPARSFISAQRHSCQGVLFAVVLNWSVAAQPVEVPSDFEFILDIYACYQHYRLDSEAQTLTRRGLTGEVDGPYRGEPITVPLHFSSAERRAIYLLMLDADVWSMPAVHNNLTGVPASRFELAVHRNKTWKEIRDRRDAPRIERAGKVHGLVWSIQRLTFVTWERLPRIPMCE